MAETKQIEVHGEMVDNDLLFTQWNGKLCTLIQLIPGSENLRQTTTFRKTLNFMD
jgi:hypothetical protein